MRSNGRAFKLKIGESFVPRSAFRIPHLFCDLLQDSQNTVLSLIPLRRAQPSNGENDGLLRRNAISLEQMVGFRSDMKGFGIERIREKPKPIERKALLS